MLKDPLFPLGRIAEGGGLPGSVRKARCLLQGRLQMDAYMPLFITSRLDEMEQRAALALGLFREAESRQGLAVALNGLGIVFRLREQYQCARDCFRQAEVIFSALGNLKERGKVLSNLAEIEYLTGDLQLAMRYYEEALALARRVGDRYAEAVILNGMGSAEGRAGDRERALRLKGRALEIAEVHGDKLLVGLITGTTGFIQLESGDPASAVESLERARVLFSEIGAGTEQQEVERALDQARKAGRSPGGARPA